MLICFHSWLTIAFVKLPFKYLILTGQSQNFVVKYFYIMTVVLTNWRLSIKRVRFNSFVFLESILPVHLFVRLFINLFTKSSCNKWHNVQSAMRNSKMNLFSVILDLHWGSFVVNFKKITSWLSVTAYVELKKVLDDYIIS